MNHWTPGRLSPAAVVLEDGMAQHMGDGYFMVMQKDATVRRNRFQRVLVGQEDLSHLQDSTALTESLEDGSADHVGDGMWLIVQRDETANVPQNVVLTAQDIGALLAAA